MADNLDFKGTVEVSVDRAISDLGRLEDQIHKAQSAFKDAGGMKDFEDALNSIEGQLKNFKEHVDQFQQMDLDQFAVFEEAFNKGLIKDPNIRKAVGEVVDLRKELSSTHDEALKLDQGFEKLANTRYALYDVAQTFTIISGAALGASGAAVKFAADYDQAFRSVQRTSLTAGAAASELKEELISLTTEIPRSFDEVTNIATLGAQMDIPTEHLTKFTETVAMFASTTDASVDKAAMSLGRLAQLTKTSVGDIDRLASSIYYTGINSVATEEQILTISEQIAASGNLAGFAADEIIGLSAAMASLGVQPEAARGAIMRIFNNIRMAVDEGGEAVQKFADVAGMSASSFAQAWLNEPEQAFHQLVEGLNRLSNEGQAVSGVLKDLGMSNVRDLRVMELLADNTEVYAAAMSDAAGAYEENSALAEGYAVQVDNLNDAMTLLWNSVKGLAAGIGEIPGLKEFVVLMGQIVERVRQFINNPLGKFFTTVAVAVVAAVGAFAAYVAIQAKVTASAYGLITAMDGISKAGGRQMMGWAALKKALTEMRAVMKAQQTDNRAFAASMDQVTASSQRASGSLTRVGAAAKATETGVKGAATAVRTFARATVVLAAISAAFWLVEKAVTGIGDSMKSTVDRVDDFVGSSGTLRDAMIADGQAVDENSAVLATWTRKVEDSGDAAEDVASSLKMAEDGQMSLREEVEDTTTAIEEQILAFGEQSKKAILDAFNEGIREADFSPFQHDLFSGLDFSEYGKELFDDIANGTDHATERLERYQDGLRALSSVYDQVLSVQSEAPESAAHMWESVKNTIAEIPEEIRGKLSPTMQEFLTDVEQMSTSELMSGEMRERINELTTALTDGGDGAAYVAQEIEKIFGITGEQFSEYAREVALSNQATQEFAEGLGYVGDEADETGERLDGMVSKVQEAANELFEGVSGLASTEAALESLGQSLYEHGDDFSVYTEGGRANLQALEAAVNAMAVNAGDDMAAFSSDVVTMLGALEAQGINTADSLEFMYIKLLELTAPAYGVDVSTAAARTNLLNLLQDASGVETILARIGAINAQIRSPGGRTGTEQLALYRERAELQKQVDLIGDLQRQISSAKDVAVRTGTGISNAIGRGVSQAYDKARKAANKAGGAGKKAGKDMAKSAKEAQKEIYTLSDYVSDLSSVMSNAFEFRFGVQTSKDATADIWASMRKSAEDARDAVKKALQEIMDADAKLKGLKSDKDILQYQLTVAEEYGDTLRASQIRAELADKNAEISKTEADKADAQKRAKEAQDSLSKSLKGNSDAARKNRSDMLSLVESYNKQIEALANSGLSSKQLQRETDKLRQDFVRQATQMGFNRKEIRDYEQSLKDTATIIRTMPKKITVNTSLSPAKRAVQEFIAKKEKSKTLSSTVRKPSKSNLNSVKKAISKGIKPRAGVTITGAASAGKRAGRNAARGFKNAFGTIRTRTTGAYGEYSVYRKGGFTGRGNFDELAGMVHRGEYVVPAQHVNQKTGLPDLNSLGQSLGMNTYNSSVSSVTNNTSVAVVELSARDRQLLQQMGNTQINLNDRVLATATNKSNLNTSRRGVG